MLVVTRRPSEKIVFPSLGITVELLRVSKSTASIGVTAPPEIRIFREEVPVEKFAPRPSEKHALANALSKVTLAVELARKLWEVGRREEADTTLETALQALDKLAIAHKPQPASKRCRALIVEDDANERELLAGLLGMSGCECATAADGVDALAYLENGSRPDVVLLDMAMPRCDGPQTLRRIRSDARFAGIRVFSVSSTSPQEVNIPDGPTGFDGWFPKPLNPRRLWDAIQDSVQSPSTN